MRDISRTHRKNNGGSLMPLQPIPEEPSGASSVRRIVKKQNIDWDLLDRLDYSDTIPQKASKSVLKQRKESSMIQNHLNSSNLKHLPEISSISKLLPEI